MNGRWILWNVRSTMAADPNESVPGYRISGVGFCHIAESVKENSLPAVHFLQLENDGSELYHPPWALVKNFTRALVAARQAVEAFTAALQICCVDQRDENLSTVQPRQETSCLVTTSQKIDQRDKNLSIVQPRQETSCLVKCVDQRDENSSTVQPRLEASCLVIDYRLTKEIRICPLFNPGRRILAWSNIQEVVGRGPGTLPLSSPLGRCMNLYRSLTQNCAKAPSNRGLKYELFHANECERLPGRWLKPRLEPHWHGRIRPLIEAWNMN